MNEQYVLIGGSTAERAVEFRRIPIESAQVFGFIIIFIAIIAYGLLRQIGAFWTDVAVIFMAIVACIANLVAHKDSATDGPVVLRISSNGIEAPAAIDGLLPWERIDKIRYDAEACALYIHSVGHIESGHGQAPQEQINGAVREKRISVRGLTGGPAKMHRAFLEFAPAGIASRMVW